MIVNVDANTVRVDEADDFKGLKVVARVDFESLVNRLQASGLCTAPTDGRPSPSSAVWLDIDRLRALAAAAPGRGGDGWADSWDRMIEFATSSGWVRDGTHVRAHIESWGSELL